MTQNDNQCEVGLRRRTYHVLSGSILGVWTHVEGVFNRHTLNGQRMQIVRVRTDNKRLVGEAYFSLRIKILQYSHISIYYVYI